MVHTTDSDTSLTQRTGDHKSQTEEQLFELIGDYGPWQRRVFIVVFLINVIGVWQNFAITFLAPNVDYRCVSPEPLINSSSFTATSANKTVGTEDKCSVLVYSNSTTEGYQKVPCRQWEYNETYQSIVSEWNLVCEREWLVSFAKSVYMIGFMASVLAFGQISDSFGRFPSMIACYVITFLSSVLSAFSTSYTMFIILRFFQAFGRTGLSTTGFVLLMEIIGSRWRTELGVAIQVGWCVGFVTLPAIAWFIPHWFWLQLTMAIPIVPFGCIYWLIPESPRWLMTRRKRKQFEQVIIKAAKINGREIKEDIKNFLTFDKLEKERENKAKTMIDLVRTPNIRKWTFNMMLLWLANSFVYYSLSYNTNDLGGDPYLNFLLSGFMEVLSYVVVFYTIRSLGRKPPLVVGMLIGGAACAASIVIPSHHFWLIITFGMIGKLCITGTFGILYIYTSELFPTVIRNVAIGSCSTSARIGSIVAPFVRELGQATHAAVPNAVNAVLAVVTGLLALLLPETKDRHIQDTLEEAEDMAKENREA